MKLSGLLAKFVIVIVCLTSMFGACSSGHSNSTSTVPNASENTSADGDERDTSPLSTGEITPWTGAEDGEVIVHIWHQYHCRHSHMTFPMIEELLERFPNSVKVVWHDFFMSEVSLNGTMPRALAGKAAHAANEVFRQAGSEAFERFIRRIYSDPRSVTEESLIDLAAELGADPAEVTEAIRTERYSALLESSMQDGMDQGIRGTPTIFVNDIRVGNDERRIERLIELVEEARSNSAN